MQRPPIATDFARPSALPTASLRNPAQRNAADDTTSEDYLNRLENEWNLKIDEQVGILVQNMVELVDMAKVGHKDQFRVAQEAFQTELKAESMVSAAESLLSLTHSLKLMLLLSDEQEIAKTRDDELQVLRKEIDDAKARAVQLWNELEAPPILATPDKS